MVASAAMVPTLRLTIFLAAIGLAGAVATAQRPAFAPVTAEMLVKPSPDDWLMYSRTYDAQRFSPLRQITPPERRQAAGGLQEGARRRHHRRHPDRVSRRDVPDDARRVGAGARRRHRRPDLGAPPAGGRLAGQDAGDLRGHGLLPVARRLHRGAGRPHRRSAVGDEDHGRHDRRVGRHRGQGADRAAPARPAARTATSPRTTPRPGPSCGVSTPPPARTSRAATPGAARPTRPAPRPPGAFPAATTRCGGWSTGAWPTRRPTRAPTATAATPPPFRRSRRPTSTATRRLRCTSTPASWPGTTSTCPATTGTRTTRTSAR